MQSLIYITCKELTCIGTDSAPIVLCVKDTVLLVSGNHTLPALLISAVDVYEDCSRHAYWRYTISYDENLLLNPDAPLLPTDLVDLFCEDCFTDWIREIIAQAIIEAQL